MKILIIHLVRFGDILQTLHVVDSLVSQNPNVEIHFLVDKSLAFFPETHSGVRKVISFDEQEHPSLFGDFDIYENLPVETKFWIDSLNSQKYQRIINFQHAKPGPLLMNYLHAEDKRGSYLNSKNQLFLYDDWTKFLFILSKNRPFHKLNLVDLYCRVAGCTLSLDTRKILLSVDENEIRDHLANKFSIDSSKKWLFFQVSASKNYRRWPKKKFQELIKRLSENLDCEMILLGSKEEESYVQHFMQNERQNLHDLCGETSFLELSQLLYFGDLLVSNDTGTMHLAAYQGCPSIIIGASEVSSYQTGPISNSAVYYLQPNLDCYPCQIPEKCSIDYKCQQVIEVDLVFKLAVQLINDEEVSPEISTSNVNIFRNTKESPFVYTFLPLQQVVCSQDKIFTEIIAWLLPKLWDVTSMVDFHLERKGFFRFLIEQYSLNSFSWMSLIESFLIEKADFAKRLHHALDLTSQYIEAIQTNDKSQRQTCSMALEKVDQYLMSNKSGLKFFSDWYALECRVIASEATSLVDFLDQNLRLLLKMQVCLENLEQCFVILFEESQLNFSESISL